MKRKILAAVLAMSMITCSMPMTVSAEGEEAGGSAQQVEETVQELETEYQATQELATQEPETQEPATPAPAYDEPDDPEEPEYVSEVFRWEELVAKFRQDGANIKLGDDIDGRFGGWGDLIVPEGNTVTLDLNGNTLISGDGVYDSMFTVWGTLILKGEGTISTDRNYAVSVEGGTFIMNGGSITDYSNTGVKVDCEGAFTMNGGSICGDGSNSGVYVADESNTFTYNGGTITDTVYLHNSAVIAIGAELPATTVFKVKGQAPLTFTSGLSGRGSVKNFVSADPNLGIIDDGYGEAMFLPAYAIVKYIERSWDEDDKEVKDTEITELFIQSFPESTTVAAGWYYLNRNVTINDRVMLQGNTNLILGDGCTLDVKGLYINAGSTLTIYGQANDTGTILSHPETGAAIGGCSGSDCGNIVIHGGTIEARGADNCAGIGSNDGKISGFITIYGGNISAIGGSDGAAIGGGRNCDGGTITIYGGEINANDSTDSDCCENGAGIGGGRYSAGGTITINGGTITAYSRDGAGIGGGDDGAGGNITINGGEVYSYRVNQGQGARIGGGCDAAPGTITINGGTITTDNGGGAGIGGGRRNTSGGTVTIRGGVISAIAPNNASSGAGIGNGDDAGSSVSVILDYTDETRDTISITTNCIGRAYAEGGGDVHLNKGFQNDDYVFFSGDTISSNWEKMITSTLVSWDGLAHTWSKLQDMIDIKNPVSITLGEDITAEPDDEALLIRSSQYMEWDVTIDLNGYTLDRGLAGQDAVDDGCVINNEGKLTIKDSVGGGVITGGCTRGNGGGIYNTGTLILEGGSITGNHAEGPGGGIYNGGSLGVKNAVVVRDNTGKDNVASNVSISSGHLINVNGSLAGADIWVSINGNYGVLTYGYSSKNTQAPDTVFHGDVANSAVSLAAGEAVLDISTLAGYTLSLGGDIGVNYHMLLSDSVIADKDTAYVKFTVGSDAPQTVLVKDAKTKTEGNLTYYVFTCKVAAKDMTTVIKAQLIDGEFEGAVDTFKVRDYTDYLFEHLDNDDYAKAEQLIIAMVNYGYYAQRYFRVNPTSPANFDHDYEPSVMDSVVIPDSYKEYTSTLPDTITLAGVSLSLESELTMTLYFRTKSTLTFTCDDDTLVIEPGTVGKYKVVRIKGIRAEEIGDPVTIKVSDGSDEYTVTYNPLAYCCYILEGAAYDADLKDVCRSLYLYYVEAVKYFKG